MAELCPCGSGNDYFICCEPYLDGTALPPASEQLMRSRYTAFCKGNIDYLLATHHPSQHRPDDRRLLTETIHEAEWLSLRVLAASHLPAEDKGTVEFVAFYRSKGIIGQLHEKSAFVREAGRWYYLNGVQLAPIAAGRNDPCWCGSGLKLKKCHPR